jgi:adenine phosphoribosyltransferase
MAAVVELVENFGAEIHECAFMAELEFLKGREKLPEGKVYSLLKF